MECVRLRNHFTHMPTSINNQVWILVEDCAHVHNKRKSIKQSCCSCTWNRNRDTNGDGQSIILHVSLLVYLNKIQILPVVTRHHFSLHEYGFILIGLDNYYLMDIDCHFNLDLFAVDPQLEKAIMNIDYHPCVSCDHLS